MNFWKHVIMGFIIKRFGLLEMLAVHILILQIMLIHRDAQVLKPEGNMCLCIQLFQMLTLLYFVVLCPDQLGPKWFFPALLAQICVFLHVAIPDPPV